MSAPILEVRGLVKRFGGLLATDSLDLTVAQGEAHAVIGPNGAGKTTLISQLAGELEPDAGTVWFNGHDITGFAVHERALAGLARSYQITQVVAEFTALENVMLAVQPHAGHSFRFWRPARTFASLTGPARDALEQVGLAQRSEIRAGEMAHGEHRQLELAMALAARPKLLLLDEPLAGMSQRECEEMIGLLAGLKGRYSMLLVEHDMDAVFALADRITVMVYGRAIACGNPEAIRASDEVRAAYLGDMEIA
jgi:branched-chain amino acid transport system ATP-binding protein